MKSVKNIVKRIPVLRDIILLGLRIRAVAAHLCRQFWQATVWLFRSREFTNYTYGLTAINKRYLAALIAAITGIRYTTAISYLVEIEDDHELRDYLETTVHARGESYLMDSTINYGRRIGWYALVRATKPRVVVETGVDKGLGSCVLTAALMKNAQEGNFGYYYGTDINPQAGSLLGGQYARFGRILYGDSIASLQNLDETIDLFINDSEHSADYEVREYKTVAARLSDGSIILGDNSHATDKLLEFAIATSRNFLFFREDPSEHWYPGAGIGIAFAHRGGDGSYSDS
jgi:predicted O-methyltransferase YrrM